MYPRLIGFSRNGTKPAWLSQNVFLELSHHVVRKPRLPAGTPGKGLVPSKVSANSQDGLLALWVDKTWSEDWFRQEQAQLMARPLSPLSPAGRNCRSVSKDECHCLRLLGFGVPCYSTLEMAADSPRVSISWALFAHVLNDTFTTGLSEITKGWKYPPVLLRDCEILLDVQRSTLQLTILRMKLFALNWCDLQDIAVKGKKPKAVKCAYELFTR